LTAASCPKKDFYTPPGGKKGDKNGGKKAARKVAKKFIPKPVLMLS
jgi:hypothetical protein